MAEFNGSWALVSSENFEAYMTAIGKTWQIYTIAIKASDFYLCDPGLKSRTYRCRLSDTDLRTACKCIEECEE